MSIDSNDKQNNIFSRMDSYTQHNAESIPASEVAETSNLPIRPINYFSRTVAALDEKAKPQKGVVCTSCTAAIWFSLPTEVKCFCQRMRNLSWQTTRPVPVTGCDGWNDQMPEGD
jgi:hypothetical protein